MRKNSLYKSESQIYRILYQQVDNLLVIDCIKMTMPVWIPIADVQDYCDCEEEELLQIHNMVLEELDEIEADRKQVMYQRYTMIAGVLPFVSDSQQRSAFIDRVAAEYGISKQSLRSYLCRYLVFQNIQALLPKKKEKTRAITQDEKNMRWALNKHFYNYKKNTLKTAYTLMLKEKYCDVSGKLPEQYPSFHQFRYFYRKTKKLQNYYISRNGLTDYQRNNRPCVGDGVQEYAKAVGTGMVDSTICDIYLINESGQLVGRPILTACVDAYSGLCCGYSLGWEGGVYSLRNMVLNVITDKVEHCRKHGITITESVWPSNLMPGKIVSDKGAEYAGSTFEQIAELGVTLVNLPPFRPELKGTVEKFFDVIQSEYKKYLKGKGVIEDDWQERGAPDYRKTASLTIDDFEKVIIRCIIYYNTQHVIENFPFTEQMLEAGIKPYAHFIWNWGLQLAGTNLIPVSTEQLILTLLPRTTGRFSRFGLLVNRMRYRNTGYTERYLKGGEVTVAYDMDSVSFVWLLEKGVFTRFELVESRFDGKGLTEVELMQEKQKELIRKEQHDSLQAEIELAAHIQAIAGNTRNNNDVDIKTVRSNRKKEQMKRHTQHVKEAGLDGTK